MLDPVWLSLTELARGLVERSFSSHEIVAAYLERIATLDGKLHAFVESIATMRSPRRTLPTASALRVARTDRCTACRSRSRTSCTSAAG